MSIQIINLNKLLKLCALPENLLVGELRSDLRSERDAALGIEAAARHFHYPWWSVAKQHVIGQADLRIATPNLVAANPNRKNLYPRLTDAFLRWFDELRRSTNEQFSWTEERVHNRYLVPELSLTLKVDNLLSLRIGETDHRLIYPYYSDFPALAEKWARVGLWLMRDALPNFSIVQMEILDILRSRSFEGRDVALRGDEQELFRTKYLQIFSLWTSLRPDYGLAA